MDFARPHLSCHINLPFHFMNKQPTSLSFHDVQSKEIDIGKVFFPDTFLSLQASL